MSRLLNLSRDFFIVSNVSTEGSAFMNVNSFHTRKGNGSRARWKRRTFDVKEVELK